MLTSLSKLAVLIEQLFLTSPRNSVAAQFNLFDRLNCKVLLSPDPRPPAVAAISDHHSFHVIEVPSVSFLLETEHPHFAFDKSWPEAQSEPLFVVHTSGSTGMPKPLVYAHATAATNTKMMSLDPPVGYESQDRVYQGKRVFIAFPPFHVSPHPKAIDSSLSANGLQGSISCQPSFQRRFLWDSDDSSHIRRSSLRLGTYRKSRTHSRGCSVHCSLDCTRHCSDSGTS